MSDFSPSPDSELACTQPPGHVATRPGAGVGGGGRTRARRSGGRAAGRQRTLLVQRCQARPCATLRSLRGPESGRGPGRLAQRESASFTPRRSLVRSQYRPPTKDKQLRGSALKISNQATIKAPPKGGFGCHVGAGSVGAPLAASEWPLAASAASLLPGLSCDGRRQGEEAGQGGLTREKGLASSPPGAQHVGYRWPGILVAHRLPDLWLSRLPAGVRS